MLCSTGHKPLSVGFESAGQGALSDHRECWGRTSRVPGKHLERLIQRKEEDDIISCSRILVFFFFFCLHYFSREVIILIVIRLRPNSGVSSFKICIFYHLLKQNVRRACQDSERWITPEQLSRAHLGWGILEDTWFVFIFVVVLGVVGMTTTDTSGCHKPQRELVIVIKRPARSDL